MPPLTFPVGRHSKTATSPEAAPHGRDYERDDAGLRQAAAQIVSAYVKKNSVTAADIPALINSVFNTLARLAAGPVPTPAEEQTPAVPIKKSVQPDRVICLECGKGFKAIRRHLGTSHGMTPTEYRAKWRLPADYPVVAAAYSAARSALAKNAGLGRKGDARKPPRKTTRNAPA